MRLACAAILILAAPLAAQSEERPARRLVLDASRALQAGNAARFLGYFDKDAMPELEELRNDVLALVDLRTIASSVRVEKTAVEDGVATMTVDWLLQLTPSGEVGAVERRRDVIEVRVRLGDEPKIVSLTPAKLFRPPYR
jgi:hypothetical protein